MLKLKMMLCVMLPLVVVGCTSKQSVNRCGKPPPPAWIMQPPPTGRHRWTGLFHPQREADHYAKATGRRNRSILMSSADRVAHIDGQLIQCVSNTHALPANCKCPKVIKPSNPFTNVAGFLFINIFCAATNFGCIDSFFCPIPETKKWWVMVSFGATAAGLFWTVNVCWAHPVISRASAVASSIFFMVLFPMLFEVRRIVCVEN